MRRSSILVMLAITWAGCTTTQAAYDYNKEPDPRKYEFVIGNSDALKITVWKNAELSTDAKVRPDGTITMPLIGDLRAAGRTPSQLKEEVTRRLAAYIRDETAAVTVAVTEVNSYRFSVSGNVERAGIFTSKVYVTVAEAIALAGGLNRFATPSGVLLLRQESAGHVRRIPIDYDQIRSGQHLEQNLVLVSGDTLYVP